MGGQIRLKNLPLTISERPTFSKLESRLTDVLVLFDYRDYLNYLDSLCHLGYLDLSCITQFTGVQKHPLLSDILTT